MKTPDEIKKGLECCSIDDYHCGEGCPYKDSCITEDRYKALEADALALIQQLEVKNAELSENIMWMEVERDDLKRHIRQLEAERDAAVKDLMQSKNSHCPFCKNWRKPEKSAVCFKCQFGRENRFEWHGV